jgi:hypothetical protein
VTGEEQEHEYEEQRQLAAILQGHAAARKMRLKEGHQHLAGQQQRHRPGQQSDHQEQAAECLQDASQAHLRHQGDRFAGPTHAAEPAEELLHAVLHEKQAGTDAEQCMSPRREARQRTTHGRGGDGVDGRHVVTPMSTRLGERHGVGEIRTHEGLSPLAVFKTAALNRSATTPEPR